MFEVFIANEDNFREEVDLSNNKVLDWFERTMDELGEISREKNKDILICCERHRGDILSHLLFEYLLIKYFLQTREWVQK
jgi:hypothetical protein